MDTTKEKKPLKRYDEGFKRSAVDMLLHSGKPLKQIARELGVTTWTLRDWKKRLGPKTVTVARTPTELEAENRALRQELERVKTQRDILKKTLGIFSTPNDSGFNA
jgi:transposase-like protein